MPSCILESPFIQLEQWRTDAHRKLDELAEQKREEIQRKISEYRTIFNENINEQKHKIKIVRKQLNDLFRQTHVTNKDIKYLESKINETKTFLQSIEKHSIQVSAYEFLLKFERIFLILQHYKLFNQ